MPVIITNKFVLGYAVLLHPAQILLSLNWISYIIYT